MVITLKHKTILKQANLHGPIITWNNSNEFMTHKQLIKLRKGLVWIPYWDRKKFNGGRTLAGSEFGNKNSFAKKFERSEEYSPLQAKKILGFVKRFSKFARGIYETCDRNFFNLALTFVVVAFSIVKFIFKFC